MTMIFHIPHASKFIPNRERTTIVLDNIQLSAELILMTDAYTDELFGSHAIDQDSIVNFPVSRLILDPERFLDDSNEPMATIGMGVVYTRTSDKNALRYDLSNEERERLIECYYRPHHMALTQAVQKELFKYGSSIIMDCHSFPSRPLPYENQASERPNVCIGTDPHHTPEWLWHAAIAAIEKLGLRYLLNEPFSGSIVPDDFYKTDENVYSIMIEINRRLYMDEKTGNKSSSFELCKSQTGTIVNAIRHEGSKR